MKLVVPPVDVSTYYPRGGGVGGRIERPEPQGLHSPGASVLLVRCQDDQMPRSYPRSTTTVMLSTSRAGG